MQNSNLQGPSVGQDVSTQNTQCISQIDNIQLRLTFIHSVFVSLTHSLVVYHNILDMYKKQHWQLGSWHKMHQWTSVYLVMFSNTS